MEQTTINQANTDTVTPPVNQPLLPPGKQNRILKLIIGFLTALLLLITTGMFYLYTQLQSVKNGTDKTNTNVVSVTPKPAVKDETAITVPSDWKTYENATYAFSFSYPQSFVYLAEGQNGDDVYIATSEGTGEGKGSPFGLKAEKDLWIKASATKLDSAGLKTWKQELDSKHNFLLDGVEAYKGEAPQKQSTEAGYGYYAYALKDGIMYTISLSAITKELGNSSSAQQIFDRIISTFKFADARDINSTSWKTYESTRLGFSISYPTIITSISGTWEYEEQKFDADSEHIGFGPASSKSGGYAWGVTKYTNKSSTDLVDEIGNQFSDRQVIEEKIGVNGMACRLITVTAPSAPNWYAQTVFIEPNSQPYTVYAISNGAVRMKEFEQFYTSFKLLD